ncbi:c-type cytochrome [Neolewinella persica]|uniref:c-type cytochrome n=1 Tax=Neolewinella persica TaxID=70998 RepID=UPI00037CA725|nr:c-type cytochrome [Neolewinella persica]
MSAKHLLPLLYASLFGVLFILALTVGYAMSQDHQSAAPQVIDGDGVPPSAASAAPEFQLGKNTWNTNGCGACHNKNMKDIATAPALGGVTARWAAYPREDLHAWIRSSQRLISEGHPRAKELWSAWKPSVMSNYKLEDEEIEALLHYIEAQYTGRP